ncbi:MAG: UDPGP type 1 family protein [Roseburia sp.]|nr:UDPGP type 1 family protein [Roseburia sp.]
MTLQEAQNKLSGTGQEHLLRYYDELSGEQREYLLGQIDDLDLGLLSQISEEGKELKRGKLEPMGAVTKEEIEKNRVRLENIGIRALKEHKVGAVLLAGGQGTRLGLDKPKGMLNVGVNKDLYLFEQLIQNIMQVRDKTGTWVPLFIMTSEKNNKETLAFFEEKNYFGYNRDFIFFFVQKMAPSVGYDGKILMEDRDKISASPNGNGGWFTSLMDAGLSDKLSELGVEWLNVFSVDNVLQKIADPVFVGAVLENECVCGAKVVAKADPSERVGVLCLEDGKPSIVEYYEMTDEMIHLRDDEGKLLYNYGVILNYLFRVDILEQIMKQSLPTHVVERKIPYMDEHGEYVKPDKPNGYKFETLVLDMIHMMDNCLSFEVEREREFAPIKNATGVDSLESARELMKKNGIEF